MDSIWEEKKGEKITIIKRINDFFISLFIELAIWWRHPKVILEPVAPKTKRIILIDLENVLKGIDDNIDVILKADDRVVLSDWERLMEMFTKDGGIIIGAIVFTPNNLDNDLAEILHDLGYEIKITPAGGVEQNFKDADTVDEAMRNKTYWFLKYVGFDEIVFVADDRDLLPAFSEAFKLGKKVTFVEINNLNRRIYRIRAIKKLKMPQRTILDKDVL